MGSYAVTPSGQSSGNYEITYVDGVLSIGRGLLTITADDAFKTYGDALAFSGTEFTVSGLLEGDSVDGVTLASAGAAAAADVASGPYPILASDAVGTGLETEGEPNYDIAYVPGALTVAPAPLEISAGFYSRDYGDPNPAFEAEYCCFVFDEGPADLGGVLSFVTDATRESDVGVYGVDATGLTSTNYEIIYISDGFIDIAPAPLTIAADDASRPYGAENPDFSASYSGFKLRTGTGRPRRNPDRLDGG